ncbi:hypothetical protein [Ectopseudomonas khazarica]|uniref:hypothetical protein n=1 Tax=Ectopseudomonas khazarica TaxID=2502979 RepID=UPI003B93DE7B
MQTIKVKIIGTRPLLMHSDIYADPLNPRTKAHKALTAKKKKTDEDHEAIAQSEWRGGMYFDEELGPYIPGINVESSIVAGGKLSRLGAQLKRSIEVIDDRCKLDYTGPRTIEGLWEKRFYDARSVKVPGARLTRYRPLFRDWSLTCEIAFDSETINREQVVKCLEDAGQYCGIGDYRPKFGRFSVEVLA